MGSYLLTKIASLCTENREGVVSFVIDAIPIHTLHEFSTRGLSRFFRLVPYVFDQVLVKCSLATHNKMPNWRRVAAGGVLLAAAAVVLAMSAYSGVSSHSLSKLPLSMLIFSMVDFPSPWSIIDCHFDLTEASRVKTMMARYTVTIMMIRIRAPGPGRGWSEGGGSLSSARSGSPGPADSELR